MLFFIGALGAYLILNALSEGRPDFAKQVGLGVIAALLPVVVQWVRYRGVGAFDWIQGGVMWVRQSPAGVNWGDWGLLFTRTGALDIKANCYEVRYRFCYGLIPYRTLEGRLKDLGAVRLSQTGEHSQTPLTTWTVHLQVDGQEESVFDAAGMDRNRGAELAEELSEALRRSLAQARG